MIISLVRPLPNDAGWVTQWFGSTAIDYSRFGMAGHNGIDYSAASGTPVLAAQDGKCYAGFDESGYGRFVRINNQDCQTIYAHLQDVLVTDGQEVKAGDQIGTVGSTGSTTGPHLHFGLKLAGSLNPAYRDWCDPVPFRDL